MDKEYIVPLLWFQIVTFLTIAAVEIGTLGIFTALVYLMSETSLIMEKGYVK